MLKSFKQFVIESSAAGNFERGSITPFKYSNFYDYRNGYDKNTAQQDIQHIFSHLEKWEDKMDFKQLLIDTLGEFNLLKIQDLSKHDIELLMRKVEEFLDSLSDFYPDVMPDGSYLIFPEIKTNKGIADIYFNPKHNQIRVSITQNDTDNELILNTEEFKPVEYGINQDDFNNTILRLKKVKEPKNPELPELTPLKIDQDFNLEPNLDPDEDELDQEEFVPNDKTGSEQEDQVSGKSSLLNDDEYSL